MKRQRLHIGRAAASCSPRHVIAPARGRTVTRYDDGDTRDIIETILWADGQSASCVIDPACLRGRTPRDTLRNVWQFVRSNVRYRADYPGHERVLSPCALFDKGVGDCKSYSIAEGALLRALGIPYRYRFASYEPGDFTHVYVVATDPDTGHDVIMDAIPGAPGFDREAQYHRFRDIRPAASHGIGSLPGAMGDFSVDFSRIALVGAVAVFLISLATSR